VHLLLVSTLALHFLLGGAVPATPESVAQDAAVDLRDVFDCDGEIGSLQWPDGTTLLPSQDDFCYPMRYEVADNFLYPEDAGALIGVGWWGDYLDDDDPPLGREFGANLYEDDGGVPGSLVAAFVSDDFHETFYEPNGYCIEIDFGGIGGERYFLSVLGVLCAPHSWG